MMTLGVEPVLSTKLTIPTVSCSWLARSRLAMPTSLPRVVLVCAPAGYGKTLLLAHWAQNSPPTTVAWLSLDHEDNDPARFLLHVIRAIQQCVPQFGEQLVTMIASTSPLPITGLLCAFINQICQLPERLSVVLDDLQVIRSEVVQQILQFLLDHQPSQLSLWLASREEPAFSLARLRGQRQLWELRATDLRFTPAEVTLFCQQVMALDLTEEQLQTLAERTEGWIVGLQLAALSLQQTHDKAMFIESFAGDDRHIADFLLDEVLANQTPSVQQFLLQTAILSRFNSQLCLAVTQNPDSRHYLEQLEQHNIFVMSLDHRREWFRYHHLLASLLRKRLQETYPDQITSLHQRASHCLAVQGNYSEAIQHALYAHDYPQAAALMEQHSQTLFSQGRFVTALAWAKQLPHELLSQHPRLLLTCAWGALVRDEQATVEHYLALIEQGLETLPVEPTLYGQLGLLWCCLACLRGDLALAQNFAHEALRILPAGRLLARMAHACLGFCYYNQGHLELAWQQLQLAANVVEGSRNLVIPVLATLGLGRICLLRGELTQAKRIYQQALQQCHELGWHELPVSGVLYVGLGELAYQQNELALAEQHLRRGVALTTAGTMHYVQGWGRVLLAQVRLSQDASATGLSIQQEALLMPYAGRFVVDIPPLSASLARLWLSQGRLDAVADWVQKAALPIAGDLAWAREAEYVVLIRYWVMTRQLSTALNLIERLCPVVVAGGRHTVLVELLILQALAWQADGCLSRALAALQQALPIAQQAGLRRLLVQDGKYLAPLLQKIAGQEPAYTEDLLTDMVRRVPVLASSPAQRLVEVLSKKEQQVARYIVKGWSSQEIADTLCVSLSTIKTHTQNIYAKLGVNRRLQAIERLQALLVFN